MSIEVRQFVGHGHVDMVNLDSGPVGLGTFEAGWRWSNDVKPLAGTDSCQVNHVGYVLSDRMRVVMDDGQQADLGPGDAIHIRPGHDAWTLGDEACVVLDFGGLKGTRTIVVARRAYAVGSPLTVALIRSMATR